jgi:hypothetical protein
MHAARYLKWSGGTRQTTPRDWLEATRWRRLSTLNRALDSFAHFDRRTDPAAARSLLVQLQSDPTSDTAPYTGRTSNLEHVTVLLAAEAVRRVEEVDEALADACWTVLRMSDTDVTRGTEPYFQRAWRLRGMAVRAEDTASPISPPEAASFCYVLAITVKSDPSEVADPRAVLRSISRRCSRRAEVPSVPFADPIRVWL